LSLSSLDAQHLLEINNLNGCTFARISLFWLPAKADC
jgi:hypothetical protein